MKIEMGKCSFTPTTDRERKIVHTLGADDWDILDKREKVSCFNNQPGHFIKKSGHTRWVKSNQVKEIK